MLFFKVLVVALLGYAAGKPQAKLGAPAGKLAHFQPLNRSPKTECGAAFDTEFGEFSSPNYPEIYPKDLEGCGYSIVSPNANRALRVRFVDFSTEAANDVVKVYNGADATGNLLATLSGNNLLETQTVVTGTGSSLYVSFSTDSSVNDRGFLAQWSTACGNRFTSQKGSIESPAYPTEYADNLDLCYDIQAASGKVVRIEFADVDTEADADVINVYDGDSEASAALATLSGQSVGNVFYSSGRNLYVSFVSNTGVSGKGFTAYYSQVCANRFGGPSGTITSPGYPGAYQNDLDECYFIEVSEGSRVQLTFDSFETENNYDIVTIYDGDSAASPLLIELDGSANGVTVTSTGNTLYVVFTSDFSNVDSGFSASYVEV